MVITQAGHPDIVYVLSPCAGSRGSSSGVTRILRLLAGIAVMGMTFAVAFSDGIGALSGLLSSGGEPGVISVIPEPVVEAEVGGISAVLPSDTQTENPDEVSGEEEQVIITVPEADSSHRIIKTDLSRNPGDEILVDNSSGYSPDIDALVGAGEILCSAEKTSDTPPVIVTEDGGFTLYSVGVAPPTVLIVHTHATECYSSGGDSYLDCESGFRSDDPEDNMIAIGRAAAAALSKRGISVLHCNVMHDKDSYNGSYGYAACSIRSAIEKYPSIAYVLDLHRDAIQYEDGSIARPVKETSLGSTAQIMFVVGTDAMGADHPGWEQNLSLALKLQTILNTDGRELARPISLRGAAYNQQYTSGSLLVEVGSCGNSADEAKNAAALLAAALADIINS